VPRRRQPHAGRTIRRQRIDPARFDPIAMKIVGLLPVSDDPCGRYRFAQPNNSDEVQTVGRVDYDLSQSQRMFGRYYLANFDRKAWIRREERAARQRQRPRSRQPRADAGRRS
jgi:hypothetical protein